MADADQILEVESDQVVQCVDCSSELPLLHSPDRHQGSTWQCVRCGSCYYGVIDKTRDTEFQNNIKPAHVQFDRSKLEYPPDEVAEFIATLDPEDDGGAEKRTALRQPFTTEVPVFPVNEEYLTIGQPFVALSRDISSKGMSLIHTRAIHAELLAVELDAGSGKRLQLVLRVRRKRVIDRFFQLAGEFVARLNGVAK